MQIYFQKFLVRKLLCLIKTTNLVRVTKNYKILFFTWFKHTLFFCEGRKRVAEIIEALVKIRKVYAL